MSQELMSVEGQLVGMPLAGPESFSQQQLDYLKRALGVDETVLWTGSQSLASAVNITTLTEEVEHFQYLELYYKGFSTHKEQISNRIVVDSGEVATLFTPYVGGSNTLRLNFCGVSWSGKTLSIQSPAQVYIKSGAAVGGANNNATLTKIVGINRIASN